MRKHIVAPNHHPHHDWSGLLTNRRVLAKAGALLAALSVFDFTTGEAQSESSVEGKTRATDWYENADPNAVVAADIDGFVTVVADFPFTAVGASWSGTVGLWPLVEIQTSANGIEFGELVVLEADADSGKPTRNDRVFTRLLFTDGESIIRYRVTDRDGIPVSIEDFGLTWIDASAGPTLDDLQRDQVIGADLSGPPAIISRAGWGADESLRFSQGIEIYPRQYVAISHAVVHHTETSNITDPLQEMRSIYYYHAVTQGWGDIGYNYLVDRFGNVYEGRAGGENVVAAHALGYNHGSSGIALIGNHLVASPNAAAVSGLVGILAWACRHLDPLGYFQLQDLVGMPVICGHLDVNPDKNCPGAYVYDILPALRTSVAATLGNGSIPGPQFTVGDLVSVDTGNGIPVNFRSGPGLTNSILARLDDGILGQITGDISTVDGTDWLPVSTFVGDGWLDSSWLAHQSLALISNVRFTNGDTIVADRLSVPLLEYPRSSANTVGSIARDTSMQVRSGPRFLDGRIWVGLTYLDGADGGWGDQADFRLTSHPVSSPAPVVGDIVTVIDAANFRTTPSLTATVTRVLPLGIEATVMAGPQMADGYRWVRLQTAFGQGWMASDFLRTTSSAAPIPTPAKFQIGDAVTNPNTLNLRSQPTTAGSIVALLSAGTIGTVVDGPTTANGYAWYRIQTSYGLGWSAGELLDKTTSPTVPDGFAIGSSVRTTTGLNMRSAASTSASVLAVLPSGSTGTVSTTPVSANGYVWYRLQTSLGTGWCAGNYLVATGPPTVIGIGRTVRTTANLRLRATASTNGTVLMVLSNGTQAPVVGGPISANGYTWWQLETSFGLGWAAGSYLALV